MDLSIIIINYNTPDLIDNCLRSIYSNSYSITLEVIIVDNNSSNDGRDYLTTKYPQIIWVQMSYNSGFARANNQGIIRSSGTSVLLLNPDTVNIDNAIGKCYIEFQNNNFVACGLQLLNEDLSPQISGNFAMKGGLNFLLPLPFLGKGLKAVAEVLHVKHPNIPDSNTLMPVDWINGAFIMVKKAAIEKAGLLDEDFFLYAEEAEWCSRLKKVGPLCIFGQYKLLHLQGVSSNKTFKSESQGYQNLFDKKGMQIMVSNFVRIRKEFGLLWFLFIFTIYVFEVPIFVIGFLISKILFRCTYKFKSVKGYTWNIIQIFKLTPQIISNKSYFYKVL